MFFSKAGIRANIPGFLLTQRFLKHPSGEFKFWRLENSQGFII